MSWAIEGRVGQDVLTAVEPTVEEMAAAAARLADFYNDPHNRRMMAHERDLSADEVLETTEDLRARRGRPFLLRQNGDLMGDADLRNIEGGTAEFAILIGNRAAQGRGLGTRYAHMIHALAFEHLGITHVFVSLIPANTGSRRLFEKLGYRSDDTPQARAFADDDTDLTMSITRDQFETARPHGPGLAEIRMFERG